MNRLDQHRLALAMIDISEYPTAMADGKLVAADSRLVKRIVELVERGSGCAVCFGTQRLLQGYGMNVHDESAAQAARHYLEGLFREAARHFNVRAAALPEIDYDRVAAMDADGYNVNRSFTPNGDHTEAREFVTTKCVHFDSATPFIANIYGPYENISGGYPIICDTRTFCADRGITPDAIVENIPNNYNVAVKAEFAQTILNDYSLVIHRDLHEDMLMIVLFNEINGGLAHAATPPSLADTDRPGKRPIRHVEYQFADMGSLARWYQFYGLDHVTTVTGVVQNVDRYHQGEAVREDCFVVAR